MELFRLFILKYSVLLYNTLQYFRIWESCCIVTIDSLPSITQITIFFHLIFIFKYLSYLAYLILLMIMFIFILVWFFPLTVDVINKAIVSLGMFFFVIFIFFIIFSFIYSIFSLFSSKSFKLSVLLLRHLYLLYHWLSSTL